MVISGCGGASKNNSGVVVTVEGGGQFPAFLAGRWEGEEGWEFTFEPNGVISSAVFSLGRVQVKPGQTSIVPMLNDGQSIFEPGEWLVDYDPNSRVLTVEVSLKHINIQMGGHVVLEGKSLDVFIGPVSENGKAWQVAWYDYPDYKAHTSEVSDANLSVDTDYGFEETVVFEKK